MKHFSTRETANILDTTEAQVRTFARLGQIEPRRGPGGRYEFTFQELLLLRTTRGLLEAGVPARRVRRVWSSLRRQLADEMPLTSITIFADGDRAVAWDGTARWRPDSGQFLLNFDVREIAERAEREPVAGSKAAGRDAPVARPVSRIPKPSSGKQRRARKEPAEKASEEATLTAEQWFNLGCELESSSPLEARQAYHHALELDPDFADAHVNLGRHYHEAGELGKAEAHYRDAVRCDPGEAVSHFNLGVLLEDRGRPDEAIHAYEQAIARDPESADAHYNLGLLLDARKSRSRAIHHLMTARRLYEGTSRGH